MENNNVKKPLTDKMNENLAEMNYVFTDIGQATIKLSTILKKDEDEERLLWLQTFEKKLLEVKEKLELLSLVYKPELDKYMITVSNCLEIESKRINYMKNLLVKSQKYEYTAQLRDIEKGIEELKELFSLKKNG
ncbi:MAG: hypothetical protein REI64_08480 [Pedobacter sp.]|uniref:hypothetical protein n=1 Tax=Pedobacter sp. TaxID=1411316 RepID=UPI0028083F04|nr:hypothetical protein [Pedobacter sp.]MDQ8004819.1 hypothetical protein [Pedobacter sp.]